MVGKSQPCRDVLGGTNGKGSHKYRNSRCSAPFTSTASFNLPPTLCEVTSLPPFYKQESPDPKRLRNLPRRDSNPALGSTSSRSSVQPAFHAASFLPHRDLNSARAGPSAPRSTLSHLALLGEGRVGAFRGTAEGRAQRGVQVRDPPSPQPGVRNRAARPAPPLPRPGRLCLCPWSKHPG